MTFEEPMCLRLFFLSLSVSLGFITSSGFSQSMIDSLLIAKSNAVALKIYLSKPDSSIALASRSLRLAEKIKSPNLQASSYYTLSRPHWAKGNYLLSTEYAFKALKIVENSPHTYQWGECLLSIGRTFVDLKNYGQAEAFINEALVLAKNKNEELLFAEAVREKSFLKLELKQYDSALYYADQGIPIYEKNKDTLSASVLYGRKARTYFEQKKFYESERYIFKSLPLDSLVKNRRALGISYYLAGQIAFQRNQFDKAEQLLKNSLRISEEMNVLSNKIRVHTLLAEIYKIKKQPDLVIKQLQLINIDKDSLYSKQKNGQIQEMKSLYELESKDKTIRLLESENILEKQKARIQQIFLISFVVVMILLAGLAYLFWRTREFQKKANKELATKNQEIELQNEEIQSQSDSLHEINQLKSKILSVISHDLRGPINNLQTLLEMVTKKHMTPEEFTDLTVKLKSNLNVSQRTLENLLNWSLGQMEGIKTVPVTFNINSIIEDVAHLSEEAATRKQIVFNKDIKQPLFVNADVNQVHLILRNLFNNAIKFSKRDGQVILHSEQKENFCYILIKDNGIGMTGAEVEMILGSNEYFTKRGTDQEKGTGLGLLLCKDFIKRNGGEFFIESKSGQGTSVSFTLPIA
jgi:two-component system, sensor histidine kinase and response regulator